MVTFVFFCICGYYWCVREHAKSMISATAIILASGMGKRMRANKNKVLLTLGRRPIVYHAIKCFHENKNVQRIVLVVRTEEKRYFHKIVDRYDFKKVFDVIDGGTERQYSAQNAIKYLTDQNVISSEILLFHNGANPFVTQEEINAVIANASVCGAAAVAHPSKDTIKEVDQYGKVITTLDRSRLWNMQTPQAIRFDVARRAFHKASTDGYVGTDDVSLVEYMGGVVNIVPASENNFKITTPRDLVIAQMIMRLQKG